MCGKIYRPIGTYYSQPCSSKKLKICKIPLVPVTVRTFTTADINCKCLVIIKKRYQIAVGLLHHSI